MTKPSTNDAWEAMARKWSWNEINDQGKRRYVLRISGLKNVQMLRQMAADPTYRNTTDLILNAPTSTAYYKYVREFPHLHRFGLENFSPLQELVCPSDTQPIPKLSMAGTNLLEQSSARILQYFGARELELTDIREISDEFWWTLCQLEPHLTSLSIREVELSENFFKSYFTQMRHLKRLSLSAFCSNPLTLSYLDVSPLTQLTWLEISDVGLENLPYGFSELKQLKGLKIANTPLQHLVETSKGEELRRKVPKSEEDVLSGLSHLDISNVGLTTLPSLPTPMSLETLVVKNVGVAKLPKCYYVPTLQVLNLSGSSIGSLDRNGFRQLKELKELDLSFTRLSELPGGPEGPRALEKLDLRGLTELRQLPEWLYDCGQLRELNLGQMQLDEFPSRLLLRRTCKFYDEVDHRVWENEPEEDLCRVLIGGLRQNTVDPQLLLLNDAALLRHYVEAQDKRPICRGNLIFLGDPGVGKSRLAEQVTEISLSEWKYFGGMKILDEPLAYENIFLQSGLSRSAYPARMSKLRVLEMGGYDAAQLIHPFFLTNHSLYVIVLQDREDLQRRALYWSKLVETYAPNGHIIFAIWCDKVIHHRLDLSLLRLSVWMDQRPEVIYLSRNDMDPVQWSELDQMIIRGLHALMLNTLCLPDAWIRLISHLEQLLETRMLLPQDMFDQLADNYISSKELDVNPKNLKRYLLTFEAATAGQLAHVLTEQPGMRKMLYHTDWLSEGLYLLTRHLYETGECVVSVEDIWVSLLDSSQHSYSKAQVKILLDFCATHNLCVPLLDKVSYSFPGFISHIYPEPEEENRALQMPEQIRSDPNTVHYTVHCPLLSRMMMTQLMIKVFYNPTNTTLDEDKFCLTQAMLLWGRQDGCTLLILGESGADTQLHFYFSSPADYPKKDEKEWHRSIIEEFYSVLKPLPEHLVQRYQITVERTSGNLNDPRFAQRAEIALDDLIGCQRAGYSSYFCGKLNRSYPLQDFTMIQWGHSRRPGPDIP